MTAWAGVGAAYAASYAELCAGTRAPLQDVLGAPDGRSLLDVGSGDGTLAAAWADAGWRVSAAEPEPTMRAESRRRYPLLEVVDAGFPSLPFADGSFDVVVANFVLNHVADPRASAAEMRRVSTDAVAATTWSRSPSWFWLGVCERAGLSPATGERLRPEKDFERTAAGFGRMLSDGGWCDVVVSEHRWIWRAAPGRLWASAEGGVASAGAFYRGLDTADRRAFRSAFDELCAEHLDAGAVALDHTAAIAVGRVR